MKQTSEKDVTTNTRADPSIANRFQCETTFFTLLFSSMFLLLCFESAFTPVWVLLLLLFFLVHPLLFGSSLIFYGETLFSREIWFSAVLWGQKNTKFDFSSFLFVHCCKITFDIFQSNWRIAFTWYVRSSFSVKHIHASSLS